MVGPGTPRSEKTAGAGGRLRGAFGREVPEVGEAVVHLDHGIARLEGLERVETPRGPSDMLRLAFRDGETLLAPASALDRIWRYGPSAPTLPLDALRGGDWAGRRDAAAAEIARDAGVMTRHLRARRKARPVEVAPDPEAMDAVATGFAHELTPDQAEAIDVILAGLADGRLTERLVVADVGHGKTEVALRAVAAVASAGGQAALVAPTTILARQHHATLARRLGDAGIEAALLTGRTPEDEAEAIRGRLASGALRVAVGTQALASPKVRWADLRLVVIDEEHRFGARAKASLRGRAKGRHLLGLSATPIPQTLAAAQIGLMEVSLILTPPARRVPVATRIGRAEPDALARALIQEEARGGRSFVVVPRIKDIAPMRARLREHLPRLSVAVAHGRMPADEAVRAVADFAEGRADVLLATTIVENGIDVPEAGTMVIWGADRLGLAELHQLRGRVGRGGQEGHVLALVPDPGDLGDGAADRLAALEREADLGAGLMLAMRDAGARGTGALMGEAQAGHLDHVGIGLHRHLFERALRRAQGEALAPFEDEAAELDLPLSLPDGVRAAGEGPADGAQEANARIALYAALMRAADAEGLARAEAMLPEGAGALARAGRRRLACRRAGVTALSAGPKGVSLGLRPLEGRAEAARERRIAAARKALGPIERRPDGLVLHAEDAARALDEDAVDALLALLAGDGA